jgi:hypothetical protein
LDVKDRTTGDRKQGTVKTALDVGRFDRLSARRLDTSTSSVQALDGKDRITGDRRQETGNRKNNVRRLKIKKV